jgi:uncharacterized protein (DUF1778 family)
MATQDIFENLVTDITAKVLEQVQQQAQTVIADAVNQRINGMVDSNYIMSSIEERINNAIVQFKPDQASIDNNINTLITQIVNGLSTDVNVRMNRMIQDKINEINLSDFVGEHITSKLDPEKLTYPFPNNSIDVSAVNTSNLTVTGDQIIGGVIKNFGSTGIDDQSTECRVTILDQGTVFENTLYAPRVEVKGGALIDGDLDIRGRLVESPAYEQIIEDAANLTQSRITDAVLEQHQNLVFDRIQNEGIDLSKVTFNGRVLVDGDRLVGVVNSQLRTVGTLQDLQTSGDSYLSDTMYVAGKRVGINTMDPKSALSVWDEEIEFSVKKDQRGVGRIAVERDKSLILGSNDKDNIILKSDGSTVISVLQINNMTFTTSLTPPTHGAQRGSVVFNENPTLGGPLGWISLGDARWANFGIID